MNESKQTGKRFEFSIAGLNDVLTETKSVKKKLSPFLVRFQKHDMSQIYQTFSHLYKCMTTLKGNLTYKFNSLFALKVLLDSSDYVLVNWIEVLFLPQIIQIAKYSLTHKDDGKNYFIELGYSPYDDAGIQKMGFNYVLLALQLIQVGARVKPYRLFQNSFLQDKSDFTLALQQLKKNGFKPPQNLSFYKPQAIETQISKFQQQLNSLSDQFIDRYTEFSNTKIYEYLEQPHGAESEKNDISIVRILQNGDLFLSSPAIQVCKAEIKQPQSLISYKNALNILHRLFINADFEVFFVLNFEDTLKQALIQVLECDKNDRSLKRGARFLSKFKNADESKRIYLIFLSNLQKWSLLASAYANENENLLKKIIICFKENLSIEFPPTQNYEFERKLFQLMRERNLQRNLQLSEQIEKKPSALEEILKRLKQQSSKGGVSEIKPIIQQNKPQKVNISPMKNMNTPTPLSGRNQSLPFAKRMNFIQDILDRFSNQPQNYEKNKAILLDFSSNFEEQLLMVPEDVFGEFSQRAFGLQKDIEEATKLGYKDTSIKSKKQKKVQQKVQVRQIDSQVFDEPSKSLKSIAKQQKVSQSKKQSREPIVDTPVKKFDFEESSQRVNKQYRAEDLGYNMPINLPVVNNRVQQKAENSFEIIKKKVYQEQQQKQQSFSITQVENKNRLGYEFLNDSNKGKEYNHPSELGYDKVVEEPVQNNWASKKEESQSQSIHSNRSIRRTEEISQSRKKIEQSAVKSISKVEHFSPQSSILNDNSKYEKSDFKKKNYEVHEQELDIPLEENTNENFSVNKPKEFASLSANREPKNKVPEQNIQISPEKFSQYEYSAPQKKPFQQSDQIMPFSNVSTPLAMSMTKQKIIKDQVHENQDYQEEELLDQDQIYPPLISPLEESFHDINELQLKIKSKTGSNLLNQSELSFKNCFETDKYILQRQQEKQNKLYWLQSDSNNLVKNILLKKEKIKTSKINIPQLLSEKNMKHQSEIKAVEEQKNSKIKELEGKIKTLQKESQFMKTQLSQHIEEIKSLKASSQYDKESVGQRGYLQDVQNIAAQKLSSPMKFGFSASRGFKLDTSNVKENVYLDPKGKLINSKIYKQYFQKFRREKDKKMVLKSKDLLYKDKDIQIGFMSKKQGERLIITLFVTPEKDLEALDWTVAENDGLEIESQPNGFISFIRAKKQEKIFFTVQVKKMYFTLPEIEFIYKISQQKQTARIMLPCSFHKFFFIKESDTDFDQLFKVNQKIIRGEQVPYSKRLLKSFDNIRDYFQCMTILNKGSPNTQGEICYGGIATYKNIQFPVRICIKPNQFLYIQGVNNQSRDQNGQTFSVIQYYISLLTHLLMKEID